MGKVTYAINMSVDGCVDYRNFMPAEDTFDFFNTLIHNADVIAYGRKMYEIMFPYWAEEENRDSKQETEFGDRLTGVDKIVFSKSLTSANYNTRIVSTDPATELLKLKQTTDKHIFVGTVSLLPQLIQQGVIDEFNFVVNPVIVGRGTRLTEEGSLAENFKLKLIESKAFKSGTVLLKYVKS
jgi:dihydrofolate reductase